MGRSSKTSPRSRQMGMQRFFTPSYLIPGLVFVMGGIMLFINFKVNEKPHVITVFLWSHPRALSTALLRSLAQLPNTATVLEPFAIPWQSHLGFARPGALSIEDVVQNIVRGEYQTESTRNVQVVKDMACHGGFAILDPILAQLPDARHVFLVRHPHRAIPSYMRAVSSDQEVNSYSDEVIREDVSYKALLDFAQRIRQVQGPDSVLVQSADDFIRDAATPLRELCEYIGVSYTPALLHWEKHVLPSSWKDVEAFGDWLDNVKASSGWIQHPNLSTEVPYPDGCSELESECIEANMPYYSQLMELSQAPSV